MTDDDSKVAILLITEEIARALEERARDHRRVPVPPKTEAERLQNALANECEKIALHLRENRRPL